MSSLRQRPKRTRTLAPATHRAVLAKSGTGFDLGTDEDGEAVAFTPNLARAHTHVLGASGGGKSKFTELLMRLNLSRRSGFCLLDPHGSLYHAMVDYLTVKRPDLASRVILVDPASADTPVVGFNPLPGTGDNLDFMVTTLVEGCLKAWGQTDPKSTPRIARWLENIFHVIAVNELTLLETAPLVRIGDSAERDRLLAGIQNDLIRDDWALFQKARPMQREAYMEGASNRIRAFLQSPAIRNMIGQRETRLDFSQIIEDRQIVLINLSGGTSVSRENMRLMGIMLVNEIFRCAKLRDPHDPHLSSFYLYIDEFGQFITQEIAFALEECRKYGLFLTLAHQHLEQLREDDRYLYASVLTNCKNRIVFGGLSFEDAEVMRREISTGFLDLMRVKDEVWQTKQRQIEETRIVRGTSRASAKGTSQSQSQGQTDGQSKSVASGQTLGTNLTRGTSRSEAKNQSRARSETRSVKTGRGQSVTRSEGKSSTQTSGNSSTDGSSTSHGWNASTSTSYTGSGHITHGSGNTHSGGSSQSATTSSSTSHSFNSGYSEGQSQTHGQAFGLGQSLTSGESETTGQSESTGESQSTSQSETHGNSRSQSTTQSAGTSATETETQSESVVPFQRSEEYRELSNRTFWSLSELEHMATARIKNQATGVAFVRFGTDAPKSVQIAHVADMPRSPQRRAGFLARNQTAMAHLYLSPEEAQANWRDRQKAIFGAAIRFDASDPAPEEPTIIDEDDIFE